MKKIFFSTGSGQIIGLFLLFIMITFPGGGLILHGLLNIPAPLANFVVAVIIVMITHHNYKKKERIPGH